MDLFGWFQVLRRRRLVFLAACLGAFGAFLALARKEPLTPPPTYTSTAKILIAPQSSGRRGTGAELVTTPLSAWFADQSTLRELLTSEELLTRVAARLSTRENWLMLRNRVDVRPVSARSLMIFTVSVTEDRPADAQRTLQALVSEFTVYVQELGSREFAATRRYLEEQITLSNQRIRTLQAEMEAASNGVPSEQALQQQGLDGVQLEATRTSLEQDISDLHQDLDQLQAFIAGQSQGPPWQILQEENHSLGLLAEEVSRQKVELQELEKVYADGDEHIVSQRKRVAEREALYQAQAVAAARSLASSKSLELSKKSARLEATTRSLKQLQAHRVPEKTRFKLDRLQRQLAIEQEGGIELVRQLNQARVAELNSRRQGAITVLERPLPGTANLVILPRGGAWKQAAGTLPLCLLLGAAVALLVEQMQRSLRLRPRVEAALDLPVLGEIPPLSEEASRRWELIKGR